MKKITLPTNLITIPDESEYRNFIYLLDYYLNQCFSLDYQKKFDFTDWEDICVMTLSCFDLYFVSGYYPEMKEEAMALTFDTTIFKKYVDENMYGSGSLDMFRKHPIKNYELTMDLLKDGLKRATQGLLRFKDIDNPSEDEIEFYSAIAICILEVVISKFNETATFSTLEKPVGIFRYAKLLWLKMNHDEYVRYLFEKRVR